MITANGQPLEIAPLRDSRGAAPSLLRRRATTEGYLFFRSLLPAAEVLAFRDVVLGLCRERGWLENGKATVRAGVRLGAYDDPHWIAFLGDVFAEPGFDAFASAPGVVQTLATIYRKSPARVAGDLCRVVSPDTAEITTRPHQDLHYLPAADGLWTVWFGVDDCPLDIGPLAVLPGSHRRGPLPHTGAGRGDDGVTGLDGEVWAASDLQAGDVLMFGGLTLHRALDNTTPNRLRLSVDFRYVPSQV